MHDLACIAVHSTVPNQRRATPQKIGGCAAALFALLGCPASGVVGRVCEADVCDDVSARGDAAGPSDTGSDVTNGGSGAACTLRYSECVLAHLATFTYDSCIPDALACGAITEQEAITQTCSARLGACLDAGLKDPGQCRLESEQCKLRPWTDGGASALDSGA